MTLMRARGAKVSRLECLCVARVLNIVRWSVCVRVCDIVAENCVCVRGVVHMYVCVYCVLVWEFGEGDSMAFGLFAIACVFSYIHWCVVGCASYRGVYPIS